MLAENIRSITALLVVCLIAASCEDVIDVDLNDAPPRLVVDGFIELNEDGTTTTEVLLTRSAPFFQETNPPVTDAVVRIVDGNGVNYNLTHLGDGVYSPTGVLAIQDNLPYELIIQDQGQEYRATETLVRTVTQGDIEQNTIETFGDEVIEITAFYNDPPGLGDAYLFEYIDENNYQVDARDDEFSDGNRNPNIFFIEKEDIGTQAELTIKGINQETLLYFETLLQQADQGGGGNPFGTQPATVRGNIVNQNNRDNFAFGYFRVSQVFRLDYTIQP
jgi:hypothetical protein